MWRPRQLQGRPAYSDDSAVGCGGGVTTCQNGSEGLGRAKHIDVQWLWLQDAVKENKLTAEKVHTEENPADLMTKPLDGRRIEYLMNVMDYELRSVK